MKQMSRGLIAAALLAAAGMTVQGSSHREALAVLNEPCADNTDTYAWVSDESRSCERWSRAGSCAGRVNLDVQSATAEARKLPRVEAAQTSW